MKKLTLAVCIAAAASLLNAEELTGDKKLACEALLCLSSSTRPSECAPSIAKYFAIKFKKPSETANARKSFLKLCPTGESDSERDARIDYIVSNNMQIGNEGCVKQLNLFAINPYGDNRISPSGNIDIDNDNIMTNFRGTCQTTKIKEILQSYKFSCSNTASSDEIRQKQCWSIK